MRLSHFIEFFSIENPVKVVGTFIDLLDGGNYVNSLLCMLKSDGKFVDLIRSGAAPLGMEVAC